MRSSEAAIIRLLRFALVLALVLCVAPRAARAHPMTSDLASIRASSATVVIATFVGAVGPILKRTGYRLDVEKALVGSASRGPLLAGVVPDEEVRLPPGTRCIAFLNKSGAFQYAATLAAGPTLEDGVLKVQGFYDFNAHWVSPSMLTFAQLTRYFATGALDYELRGKLQFLAPKAPGLAPSAIDLVVTYDAITSTSSVRGMPALGAFPATPKVLVMGNDFDSQVSIIWENNVNHPLAVGGEPTGVDAATGAILMRFWVEEPSVLTEGEFRRYIADPRLGPPYHKVTLSVAGGPKGTVELGNRWHLGQITDLTGAPREISSISTDTTARREMKASGILVTLDPQTPGLSLVPRIGEVGTLVQELLAGPLGCTITGLSPTAARCTLELRSTEFAQR